MFIKIFLIRIIWIKPVNLSFSEKIE